jgi:predicted Zn-dependent protease with MMP-like domain
LVDNNIAEEQNKLKFFCKKNSGRAGQVAGIISIMINNDLFAADLNFSQFNEIFAEELSVIPDQFREGLAQFVVEEQEYRYSKYMPGLYTLGHYMPRGHLGQPIIILYFGSFKRAFPHAQVPELRQEVAKTIAHELLHHWELKSGYDDLGEEDRARLQEWKVRSKYRAGEDSIGRNLLETALYIYMLFILVAVIARWLGLGI